MHAATTLRDAVLAAMEVSRLTVSLPAAGAAGVARRDGTAAVVVYRRPGVGGELALPAAHQGVPVVVIDSPQVLRSLAIA